MSESSIAPAGDGGRLVLGVLVPPRPHAGSSGETDFSGAAQKGAASSLVEGMAKSYTELAMLGRNLGSEKTLGTWEGRHCKKSSS